MNQPKPYVNRNPFRGLTDLAMRHLPLSFITFLYYAMNPVTEPLGPAPGLKGRDRNQQCTYHRVKRKVCGCET